MPSTPKTLVAHLRAGGASAEWQLSWRRFLEIYHEPLAVVARACYRHHAGGAAAPDAFIEDAIANVVVDFFSKGCRRYDPARGRLRTYLRMLVNARVVDLLRKERPFAHRDEAALEKLPPEATEEVAAYRRALLLSLVEDLRDCIPARQFEIFERVKLKGEPADAVASDLGVRRGVVDNTVFKVMGRLRDLASRSEYSEEAGR